MFINITYSLVGGVKQDAVDWRSDQHGSSCLLDYGDHVIGYLTGTPFRVPGTRQVVAHQQTVHGETGFFWRVSFKHNTTHH